MKEANFLKPALEELAFIELNKDTTTLGLTLKKGFYLPLLYSDLEKNVKEEREVFDTEAIMAGILFLYGLDEDFRDGEIYRAMLLKLEENTSLLPFVVSMQKKNRTHALIMSLGYIHLSLADPHRYVVASELANALLVETEDKNYQVLAKALLEKGREVTPTWEIDYHLSYVYYHEERYEEAKALLQGLLERDEVPDSFIDEIATLQARITDKELFKRSLELLFDGDSRSALEGLNDVNPEYVNPEDLYFFKGLAYRLLGAYDDALHSFEEVMALKRFDSDLYNEMAICHMFKEDYEKAETLLRAALELDEKSKDLYSNLGISLCEQGKIEEGRGYFKKVLEIDPEDEISKACLERYQA
ncbi:tetratricopeptide repeat protein [Guggenheimella bovis]